MAVVAVVVVAVAVAVVIHCGCCVTSQGVGTLRHSLLQPACSNLTSKIRPSVLSPRPSWADPGKALLAEQVAETLVTMAQSESKDGFRIWNFLCYFCLSPYDVIRWLDAGLTQFRCMGQGSRNTKASYTP